MGALLELVDAGVVGELRHVDAAFGFEATGPRTGRLFDPALGGGGVLDVGGYPVSFARLLAGRVERRAFAEPTKLEATGVVGPTGVDEVASAKLSFASGFTANVSCAVRRDLGTTVTIVGTRGRIELPNPWLPGGERQGLASSFTIHGDGKAPETITLRAPAPVYALQADLFAEALPTRAPRAPAMSLADSLGNMRVLDAWRTAVHAEARS
jgi:predicted dehydrogenase